MSISARRYIYVIIIGAFSVACTNHTPAKQQKIRSAYSMVATSSNNVHFSKGSIFSWLPQSRTVLGDTRINKTELGGLLDQSFKDALQHHGYQWSHSSTQSQYLITYVGIAGDTVSEADISQTFKLDPGLHSGSANTNNYDKGTLLVNIVDSRSRQSVWQVAIQANLDRDDDLLLRQQRINNAIRTLVAKMP